MRILSVVVLTLVAHLAFETEVRAQASYSWFAGSFGTCSVACGGGTQTRPVECRDANGVAVADAFCDPALRPTDTQSCNTQACSYVWVAGEYGSCSAACGGGTQTRPVVCEDGFGNAVSDALCDPALRPTDTQSCNTQACSYVWVVGGFGSCSAACGGGTQTRPVTCEDGFGTVVSDALCDPGLRPSDTQSCNTQACSYVWVVGGFGSCSAACGGGTQTRPVTCEDGFGTVVSDALCDPGLRPSDTQSCNTQACTYGWVAGPYGSCSAVCGGGTQTRPVVCEDETGAVVSDAFCDPALRPGDSQSCNTQACLCEPGGFIGLSGCTPCAPGTFTDQGDQTSCMTCPGGTFAASPGSTECTACPAGTSSPPGAESCTANPAVPAGSPVGALLLLLSCGLLGAGLLAAARHGSA